MNKILRPALTIVIVLAIIIGLMSLAAKASASEYPGKAFCKKYPNECISRSSKRYMKHSDRRMFHVSF